jgi:putative transposase
MSSNAFRRCRTYKYRLYPTKRQEDDLVCQLSYQRELYNAALEERIGAWKWEQRSVNYFNQCKTLSSLKEVRPEVLGSGITLCRGTLKRVDRAYAAFFRRVRSGETPGFPRFKGVPRFDSLEWVDKSGWKLTDEHRLRLLGVGVVKMNYHRPLAGTPRALTVKREGRKWWVSVRCVEVPAEPLERTGREVGLDLGIVNLLATSEGELVDADRFARLSCDHLAVAQRSLDRETRVESSSAAGARGCSTAPQGSQSASERPPPTQSSTGQSVRPHCDRRPQDQEHGAVPQAAPRSIKS